MAITKDALYAISLGRGGSYSLSRDVLKHYLYDTRFFTDATVDDFTFFSQPTGAPWRVGNKSINEINISTAGTLPNGQTFLVTKMSIALICPITASAVNGADLVQAFTNIVQSSVFELFIAGRQFDFQIHGRQFLPTVFVNTDQQATNEAVQQRVGDVIASGHVSLMPAPVFIGQLINFGVLHRFNNPDGGVRTILGESATLMNDNYCTLQVALEGIFTRAK